MKFDQIEKQFLNDVKDHGIDIKLDIGAYRHIKFKNPKYGYYWFELITTPNQLTIHGDCGTYVFSRIEDMFCFFSHGCK